MMPDKKDETAEAPKGVVPAAPVAPPGVAPEPTEDLDETVPGGVYIKGGKYVNAHGEHVTAEGQPSKDPVVAEGYDEDGKEIAPPKKSRKRPGA